MLDKSVRPTVIALGYFDSVHLGHQKLIKQAREYADINGYSLTVFTFKGNLKAKLNLEDDKCVYLPRERQKFIRELGADYIYFAPITKAFLCTGKLAFLNKLNKQFNIKCYFSGCDYTFGKFGKGNVQYLSNYAKEHNQQHIVVSTFNYLDEKVSTTRIKQALSSGNVKIANKLLGRNYSITGRVIPDRNVGAKIGFPTANVAIDADKFMLKNGVYYGKVSIDGEWYSSLINYGSRPTFNIDDKIIEAHILDFEGNLYKREITLDFIDFIREIKKFDSKELLAEQIQKDILLIKGKKYD